MTSGKKNSNPVEYLVCEICKQQFTKVVYPCYRKRFGLPRFCSVKCRNIFLAREKSRTFKSKPKIARERRERATLWTADRVKFLTENYPTIGAKATAEALGLSYKQTLNRAGVLGLTYTRETAKKLIYNANSARMKSDNPMFSSASVDKAKAYWINHPKENEDRLDKLAKGKQKVQRDKPTKLEIALFSYLEALGVEFEPYAIVKPRFIVDAKVGRTIIQADGDYWHGHARFGALTDRQLAQQNRDRAQDAYLEACGYTVVRIWESDMSISAVAKALGINPPVGG